MSKRDVEDTSAEVDAKKAKVDKKDDNSAIDSELLGQQSSYAKQETTIEVPGTGESTSATENKEEGDQDIAEAAAAAAVAAEADKIQDAFKFQQQQQHQQQQQAAAAAAASGAETSAPVSRVSFQATTLPTSNKPHHGTDEWHRQRRENHKEVERRRRESINLGIKELATLIPTQDTNKAQILQRAVEYIKRLKENENNNIEKWTLEKLLTEQAVSDLSSSNEKLKSELERAYKEIEQWKSLARTEKS
ncbi:hypothetical protein DFJ63DRAFT_288460 [Scheffersomyces coipomensis]|uniref:uncharacterized protein n=1 Tax=Scheffersomyces coipomensis TaxID=1788519 RepID=UPI00315D091E